MGKKGQSTLWYRYEFTPLVDVIASVTFKYIVWLPIVSGMNFSFTLAAPLVLLVIGLSGCTMQLSETRVVAASSASSDQSTTPIGEQTEELRRVVRKEITPETQQQIPPVLLSTEHASLCRVRVGDEFPEMELPRLSGGDVELASLQGVQATVILFWQPDRWMSHTAIGDLVHEVTTNYDSSKVSIVGVAVSQPAEAVRQTLSDEETAFPQLLDTDGKAFNKVGMQTLPRVYVLGPTGKIVWFDIEYSEGTRRELKKTLEVLANSE